MVVRLNPDRVLDVNNATLVIAAAAVLFLSDSLLLSGACVAWALALDAALDMRFRKLEVSTGPVAIAADAKTLRQAAVAGATFLFATAIFVAVYFFYLPGKRDVIHTLVVLDALQLPTRVALAAGHWVLRLLVPAVVLGVLIAVPVLVLFGMRLALRFATFFAVALAAVEIVVSCFLLYQLAGLGR